MILRDYQSRLVERAIEALSLHGNTLAVAPTGAGKCLGRGTPVLMYNGAVKPVEDVVVGDLLMGPDSQPRRVESLARGAEEMYRVVPTKGEPYEVNKSHILSLKVTGGAEFKGYRMGDVLNIPLQEYLKKSTTFKHCVKGWRTGVDFKEVDTGSIITPYILGVWLGDGDNLHCNGMSFPDEELLREVELFCRSIGMGLRREYVEGKCPHFYVTNGDGHGGRNAFKRALRSLGLPRNKHIPKSFKVNSRFVRLEVLAGILDTDGHLSRSGYDYITKDKALADDVAFVARSLGLAAYVKSALKKAQGWADPREYWRVSISGDCSMIPCRVARKKAPGRKQKKDVLRTGISVESIGVGEYFGFEISGSDRLFLLGDFTVTHNTICLSAIAKEVGPKHAIILQHRDELVEQNRKKFRMVWPKAETSVFNAASKEWSRATFAMVQTLSREGHLSSIPKVDLLVIDEAHHATAPTYRKIIDAVKEKNPSALVCGLTATASRGDGKGMRRVFSNVCDQITLEELIDAGFLVPPRTFVCTPAGVAEELENVRKTKAGEFDLEEVETVMDKEVHNQRVVEEWVRVAGGRKTIAFASTVKHAQHVARAFNAAGILAAVVSGETPKQEREDILKAFDSGPIRVLVNCAVLTEGYDSQPVSCVILLRPCSYKSTMIQMVGRGLRTVDPKLYPGVEKNDCLVLDFGTSISTHGDLCSKVRMDDREQGEAPTKTCPDCQATIPQGCGECPLCGYEFAINVMAQPKDVIRDVALMEVSLMNKSPFKWIDLFSTGKAMMASGFSAWVGVFSADGEKWTAVGHKKGEKPRLLAKGEKIPSLARADDFLRMNEEDDAAKKAKRWLNDPASPRQWELLSQLGYQRDVLGLSMTKYTAACSLNFGWNRRHIEGFLQ